MGIIAIVLISNPIHTINQFELVNVIAVPVRRARPKIITIKGFIC